MNNGVLLNKIQEFENIVKKTMQKRGLKSFDNLYLYCGSTAMNLLFMSEVIQVYGKDSIEANISGFKSKMRKMHDIDIHVFNEELYQDLERERDENGSERKDYPYKIKYDSTWFGEPKRFLGDNEEYIVIDRFKEQGTEKCPQDYAVIKIGDRQYKIESPLNLLAYKIAFSLQQAEMVKYPRQFSKINEQKLENNSYDIDVLSQVVEGLYSDEIIKQHIFNVLENIYGKDLKSLEKMSRLKEGYDDIYCNESGKISCIHSDIVKRCLNQFFEEQIGIDDGSKTRITKEDVIKVAKKDGVVDEKENAIQCRKINEGEILKEKKSGLLL